MIHEILYVYMFSWKVYSMKSDSIAFISACIPRFLWTITLLCSVLLHRFSKSATVFQESFVWAWCMSGSEMDSELPESSQVSLFRSAYTCIIYFLFIKYNHLYTLLSKDDISNPRKILVLQTSWSTYGPFIHMGYLGLLIVIAGHSFTDSVGGTLSPLAS